MRRVASEPRRNWQSKVEELGLSFHTPEQPYWYESAHYVLSAREVDVLEKATNRLHQMCLAAAGHVIEKRRYSELGIPGDVRELIERSWEDDTPSIYGRFDFSYDGSSPPKLLEYNADTPTALYEAAVIQWKWLEEVFEGKDQFNSIHERLVATWKELKGYLRGEPLYFASLDDAEDIVTVTYLRDTAKSAGIATDQILVSKIGWDRGNRLFVDEALKPMEAVFKLYPWEWMLEEDFGDMLLGDRKTQWIEPAWKVILSSKGILPILWELNPGDPNLLEASFSKGKLTRYVQKPLFSREGSNVTLYDERGIFAETGGDYGKGESVYQALAPLPEFDGQHPVIGSWIIGQEAAGIGIRESEGPITDNRSRFVPHRMG
ncbi:MAG: glutathionylspermidine synthase family protein [Acidobacteria bacterium]|nr:glutathionylspermidine synthase family protein [Acidobacteriota bacterium]MCA1609273.1 glutathionylspermidine synthase family protein [Acidobacteriota bacterium]